LFFTLSVKIPWLAFPGIFLFNTTMAITATQLYRCLPQFPGTMFGLTTLALFLGVLPRLLGAENLFFSWWGLGLLSLVSALSLLGGLVLGKGGQSDAHIAGSFPGADIGH
jgi:FSR family fosmidomycin resistance protein-like MFS transporter